MGKARNRRPRRLSLVRFAAEAVPPSHRRRYPFKAGRAYLFLGEISNLRGHCVLIDPKTQRVYSGYHTENFVELKDDEL